MDFCHIIQISVKFSKHNKVLVYHTLPVKNISRLQSIIEQIKMKGGRLIPTHLVVVLGVAFQTMPGPLAKEIVICRPYKNNGRLEEKVGKEI